MEVEPTYYTGKLFAHVPWTPSTSPRDYHQRPFRSFVPTAKSGAIDTNGCMTQDPDADAVDIPVGHYGPDCTPDKRIEKCADGTVVIGKKVGPASLVRFALDVIMNDEHMEKNSARYLGKYIDCHGGVECPTNVMENRCNDVIRLVDLLDTYPTEEARVKRIVDLERSDAFATNVITSWEESWNESGCCAALNSAINQLRETRNKLENERKQLELYITKFD